MESSEQKQEISYIISEFLEVAIHSILHSQKIYPSGIFKKCQKYKAVAMMSTYPKLTDYISCVISSLQPLIAQNEIEEVYVEFYNPDDVLVRTYVFEVAINSNGTSLSQDFLFQTELQFRGFLIKLASQEPLKGFALTGCRFQIKAKCKRQSLDTMNDRMGFQEFPWIIEDKGSDRGCPSDAMSRAIVPIKACHQGPFKLQCYLMEQRPLDDE